MNESSVHVWLRHCIELPKMADGLGPPGEMLVGSSKMGWVRIRVVHPGPTPPCQPVIKSMFCSQAMW